MENYTIDWSLGFDILPDNNGFVKECTQKLAALREELKVLQERLEKLEEKMKKLQKPKLKTMIKNSGSSHSGTMRELKKPYPNRKVSPNFEDGQTAEEKQDLENKIQNIMEQLADVKIVAKNVTEGTISKSVDVLLASSV